MLPWIWPRAAYVHVPFCAHHCGYCDFAVAAGQDERIGAYLDAVEAEMSSAGSPQQVTTIHLGGGTPSHLAAHQLERLLLLLNRWVPLEPGGEFSLEANPDSLTEEKVALLAEHGVNRVSIGAQSFHPHLLNVLERQHDVTEVARAVERCRGRINRISLDLIFAVPGQSLEEWHDDLTTALSLKPDHLSTYGLTFEKGTRLWKQRRQGLLKSVEEEAELDMYRLAIDTLEDTGMEHYEISNFAYPGSRSRHNQVYWANEAYFGFGMGAARYVRGRREINTRDLETYITRCLAGQSPTQQSEELPPLERAKETMAVQLRRMEGIDRERFREQTGFALDAVTARLPEMIDQGLLDDDGLRVCLTRRGKYVADAVIERLL